MNNVYKAGLVTMVFVAGAWAFTGLNANAQVQFCITAPDAVAQDFVNAVVDARNYQAIVTDPETGATSTNPVTPQQFAKQEFINHAKNMIEDYRTRQAIEAAKAGVTPANGFE